MSSSNIVDKIDVHAYDETWGSDHVPVYIYYDTSKSYYEKKSFKIKSLRTDWAKFDSIINDS